MSYQLRDREIKLYMPYKEGGEITNHFMISSPLKEEISENFLLVGQTSEINYLQNTFVLKKHKTPKYNFTKKELKIYEVMFD